MAYSRSGTPVVSRRAALRAGLAPLGLVAAERLLPGCSGKTIGASDTPNAPEGGARWATGGTASMAASYPDPFTTGLGSACAMTCSATLGPCYAQTVLRKDITEGQAGLPTRLAFLVVDEGCKPVDGATVDIWHTSPGGLYSGNDSVAMCTSGNAQALAARWFRGVQPTDSKGRADFDTCFPGWYSGRTIHIHLTVRVNGVEYLTSQLYFDDSLDDSIVATEPLYKDRGPRSTTNLTDGVIAGADFSNYVFETERMSDGVLLAWKALVLRSSASTPLCVM